MVKLVWIDPQETETLDIDAFVRYGKIQYKKTIAPGYWRRIANGVKSKPHTFTKMGRKGNHGSTAKNNHLRKIEQQEVQKEYPTVHYLHLNRKLDDVCWWFDDDPYIIHHQSSGWKHSTKNRKQYLAKVKKERQKQSLFLIIVLSISQPNLR